MKKLEWHTEQRKIKELIPFDENPRKQLQKSIEKINLVEIPVAERFALLVRNLVRDIIDKDNKIIAGHQRLNVL